MLRFARTGAWAFPFGLLVMTLVAVPLHLFDEQGLPRYRALRDELQDVRAQNDRLHAEVRDRRREVDSLRRDPEAIEQIARDELGMIRPDEIVFQFE
jgi:cell division protein FtsB